jgi:LacI family gluconate utilization system Gnt-I transcriptional repressor
MRGAQRRQLDHPHPQQHIQLLTPRQRATSAPVRRFPGLILRADFLASRGYQILLSNTYESIEEEENICRAVLGWRPDGVIIAGNDHTAATRQMLLNSGVPVVEAMELGDDPIDMNVDLSHYQAGFAMGRKLVATGYQHIVTLATASAPKPPG